jgi:peroxiredoxin
VSPRRRTTTRILGSALVAVTLVACSGGDDDLPEARPSVTPSHGGAAALPGPVPATATYAAPPPSAPSAPPLKLTLVDGSSLDVANLWQDRPVVLYFFSSWCTVCVDQQAKLNALAERYADTVPFVGVAGADKAGDLATYVNEHEVAFPVAFDDTGEVWRRYAVSEPPLVAVIAKGGKLVYGLPGEVDLARLEAKIKEQLAHTPGHP